MNDATLTEIRSKGNPMRILTCCDHGNNRSVHFAHLLKYKYNADVIPVGLQLTSEPTLLMLFDWADHIILVERKMLEQIPLDYIRKTQVWEVGEDRFERPFNKELYELCKKIIEENPLE